MTAGRPTLFKPEYIEQAKKLALLGATDKELADFFEVDVTEDDFLRLWLKINRQDRNGVIAHRKEKVAKIKKRLRSTPSGKIENSVRARMWSALRGEVNGKLFKRLGYTSVELMDHLESKFLDGMNWENYGAWHIDHIIPCASFDMTNEIDFNKCWALINLQPLWAKDNFKKGAKIVPS